VLFFTTRIGNADDCDECGRMGEQLSLLKQEYNEDLLIFTVPTDMEDGLIEMLEGQFNITDIPTAVINGNKSKTVEGFKSRDQIRKHLTVSTDE
jgi:thioredoxin-like negative regulator of GroEL